VKELSDDDISGLSLVIHNVIGILAMLGALAFFISGLLTPRTAAPDVHSGAPVA